MLNLQDEQALTALSELYPLGKLSRFKSKIESKDFLIFVVLEEK
jgi:hypothetical protein